jgi:hypothetical protein
LVHGWKKVQLMNKENLRTILKGKKYLTKKGMLIWGSAWKGGFQR